MIFQTLRKMRMRLAILRVMVSKLACWVGVGNLFLAVPTLRAVTETKGIVREQHNKEIEQIANQLSGGSHVDDYFSFVLLPLLGFLGIMFCLRHVFRG